MSSNLSQDGYAYALCMHWYFWYPGMFVKEILIFHIDGNHKFGICLTEVSILSWFIVDPFWIQCPFPPIIYISD